MEDREFVKELIHRFKVEYEKSDRSGAYAYTSRTLAYNSNKIEGSKFTIKQTIHLFETGTINVDGDEVIRAKDVEEMNGHFLMFNNMLSTYHEPLSIQLIKQYHYSLKAGVFEDKLNGYPVGEFKNRDNIVSNIKTSRVENVEHDMEELLKWYHEQKTITLDILANFHLRYETIHPFQDGNGRTGRIILFKECLKNEIIPFIIKDEHKEMYYSSLIDAQTDAHCQKLIDLFKSEQADYYNEVKGLVIPRNYH